MRSIHSYKQENESRAKQISQIIYSRDKWVQWKCFDAQSWQTIRVCVCIHIRLKLSTFFHIYSRCISLTISKESTLLYTSHIELIMPQHSSHFHSLKHLKFLAFRSHVQIELGGECFFSRFCFFPIYIRSWLLFPMIWINSVWDSIEKFRKYVWWTWADFDIHQSNNKNEWATGKKNWKHITHIHVMYQNGLLCIYVMHTPQWRDDFNSNMNRQYSITCALLYLAHV